MDFSQGNSQSPAKQSYSLGPLLGMESQNKINSFFKKCWSRFSQSELYDENFNSAVSFCYNWGSLPAVVGMMVTWKIARHKPRGGAECPVRMEAWGQPSVSGNMQQLCHSVTKGDAGRQKCPQQRPGLMGTTRHSSAWKGTGKLHAGLGTTWGAKKLTLLNPTLPDEVPLHSWEEEEWGQGKLDRPWNAIGEPKCVRLRSSCGPTLGRQHLPSLPAFLLPP